MHKIVQLSGIPNLDQKLNGIKMAATLNLSSIQRLTEFAGSLDLVFLYSNPPNTEPSGIQMVIFRTIF
jgi:hypothetical protein